MSQLGKRLAALLLIDGSPFKDTRETYRYEARFKISAEEGVRFPTPEGLTWDGVSPLKSGRGISWSVRTRPTPSGFTPPRKPSRESPGGGRRRWEGRR